MIMKMMTRDLSEPYPIYTYRFFVQQWPGLTLLAYHEGKCLGCIVSKLDDHKKQKQGETQVRKRGYIAMLSVEPEFRKIGLGRLLVKKSIDLMIEQGADEVMLETEVTN
jgi:N-alpha-acetyltransferase 30